MLSDGCYLVVFRRNTNKAIFLGSSPRTETCKPHLAVSISCFDSRIFFLAHFTFPSRKPSIYEIGVERWLLSGCISAKYEQSLPTCHLMPHSSHGFAYDVSVHIGVFWPIPQSIIQPSLINDTKLDPAIAISAFEAFLQASDAAGNSFVKTNHNPLAHHSMWSAFLYSVLRQQYTRRGLDSNIL